MPTAAHIRCLEQASDQHGVFSLAQGLDEGLSLPTMYRLVARGELQALFPGVFGVTGSPDSPLRRLKAADLHGGETAAVCGLSAAALHGLDGFSHTDRPELVTTGRLRARGVRYFRTRSLRPEDVVQRDGIRVTSVHRTVIDLARRLPEERLEQALDSALVLGLTSVPYLWRYLNRLGGRGRKGVALLRILLLERAGPARPHASLLEIKLEKLLRDRLHYRLERQFEIHDGDRFVARTDFAIPELRIALEAQSYRFHEGKRARITDARRLNALQRLGWVVLYFYWEDVDLDPDYVVDEVASVIASVEHRPDRIADVSDHTLRTSVHSSGAGPD